MTIECKICNKDYFSTENEGFLKSEDGSPLYFADPQFHKQLMQKIYFCGAGHSLAWFEKEYQKEIDNTTKTS